MNNSSLLGKLVEAGFKVNIKMINDPDFKNNMIAQII